MAAQRSTDNIDVPNRSQTAWGLAPTGYNGQLQNLGLIAEATVNPYRAVVFGTSDNLVIQGAAATDKTIGVNQAPQAALAGQPVMVAYQGIGKLELGTGGAVRGDLLTSDSVGRGVISLAAPTDRVIGVALQSGVIGDVILVSISPSKNGGVT